jgi:hypothetical protein
MNKSRTQTEKYLVDRIDSFSLHIETILNSGKQKRLEFISLIDFWDWELENIMFAVSSIEERQKMGQVKAQRVVLVKKKQKDALDNKVKKLCLLWNALLKQCAPLVSLLPDELAHIDIKIYHKEEHGVKINGKADPEN